MSNNHKHDIETLSLGLRDRIKLDAIAERLAAADRMKAQAEVLRESARGELCAYLDKKLGGETNAVYCVSTGVLVYHRLGRYVSFNRIVNAQYLSTIVPFDLFTRLATVPVGALEAAIKDGTLGAGILSRVIESADDPVERYRLDRPSPSAKVKIEPGQIASWDVEPVV